MKSQTLEEFQKQNRVSDELWAKANISWETLSEIGDAYTLYQRDLELTAEFFARTVQKFSGVHSVRWRVKETDHLLEKIVRKRAVGEKKYGKISVSNYSQIVTDLIGLRALHLLKHEFVFIDKAIRSAWKLIESPIVYLRKGDDDLLFREIGLNRIKPHPAGYRSVHYVIASELTRQKVVAEVQVRTIFEEGWSEIDHKVRYPNFGDDPLIAYFLSIFNKMAGNADDMGSFVKSLTEVLELHDSEIATERSNTSQWKREAETRLAQLSKLKAQDRQSNELIEGLRADIEKLAQTSQGIRHPKSPAEIAAKYGVGGQPSPRDLLYDSMLNSVENRLRRAAEEAQRKNAQVGSVQVGYHLPSSIQASKDAMKKFQK